MRTKKPQCSRALILWLLAKAVRTIKIHPIRLGLRDTEHPLRGNQSNQKQLQNFSLIKQEARKAEGVRGLQNSFLRILAVWLQYFQNYLLLVNMDIFVSSRVDARIGGLCHYLAAVGTRKKNRPGIYVRWAPSSWFGENVSRTCSSGVWYGAKNPIERIPDRKRPCV